MQIRKQHTQIKKKHTQRIQHRSQKIRNEFVWEVRRQKLIVLFVLNEHKRADKIANTMNSFWIMSIGQFFCCSSISPSMGMLCRKCYYSVAKSIFFYTVVDERTFIIQILCFLFVKCIFKLYCLNSKNEIKETKNIAIVMGQVEMIERDRINNDKITT